MARGYAMLAAVRLEVQLLLGSICDAFKEYLTTVSNFLKFSRVPSSAAAMICCSAWP